MARGRPVVVQLTKQHLDLVELELRLDEELAREARLDPVKMARLAGYPELDGWQRECLTSKAQQLLLNCSRQSGKTSITGLLALHEAITSQDELILLLSAREDQAKEMLRIIKKAYTSLVNADVKPKPMVPELVQESTQQVQFENESRIVCLPSTEGTIRGYSGVRLLVIDEASWVPDEVYQAVRPMLAVSRGRIVLLSTPHGKRGFFWKAWDEESDWHKVMVTADQCPRISKEFLESEKARIGEWWLAQEYFCAFRDPADAAFVEDDILAMLDESVKPLSERPEGEVW